MRQWRRYLRTVRTLRPKQIAYQVLRRLQPARPGSVSCRRSVDRDIAVTLRDIVLATPPDREDALERAGFVLDGSFEFLNHRESLDPVDWSREYVSPLWTYKLHYFDFVPDLAWSFHWTRDERYLSRIRELTVNWMSGSNGAEGRGWDPYPISVRAMNWIRAFLLLLPDLDPEYERVLTDSLCRQLEVLSQRLEWHLLANHVLKNLATLTLADVLFPVVGERGVDHASLLWKEVEEQVGSDGGHFERSPMYHAIVQADLLELLAFMRLAGRSVPPDVRSRVGTMAVAFGRLSREEGSLHLFNDSIDGEAPSKTMLRALSQCADLPWPETAPGPWALPETGYYGESSSEGSRLIVDCGPPGPSYQPAHAHCDLLSFELDIRGVSVVVDCGVHGYDGDPYREYARSTRAHNTVSIDGREQSEPWATFRMGGRGRVISVDTAAPTGGYRFSGAYAPHYDRGTEHHRIIERRSIDWTVTDRVTGRPGARLSSYLHLHPTWLVRRVADRIRIESEGRALELSWFGIDEVIVRRGEEEPQQGWFFPEFGRAEQIYTIEMIVRENDASSFGFTLRPMEWSSAPSGVA